MAGARRSVDEWGESVRQLCAILSSLEFRDDRGRRVGVEQAFARWRRLALDARRQRRTVFLIGNGASASMASHFAADLAKNAALQSQVFSDLALITAISNDLSYEEIFAEPLRRRGQEGDMLVAISSSGNSRNVLAAVDVARQARMRVITLSAMDPRNPLRARGTLNAYVRAATYGDAESCHAAILHHWMDLVEASTGKRA